MQKLFVVLLILSWALWFGGMIVLFIFVMRLFGTNRNVAVDAAPILFNTFAVYQLIVGMIACASGTLLTLISRRNTHAAATLLMILSLAAGLVLRSWTIEMGRLDRGSVAGVSRFQTLHHNSTRVYTSAAILLMIAGILFTLTLPAVPSRRKEPETAAA
jgi:glucan phosphoethanolaminetransferase (alkaline phosphatase superfamily)